MLESTSEAAKILGERMLAERQRTGCNQEEIAHLAGMNVANYGKIERGLGNPTFETLIRISSVLEVDPAKLVTGISDKHLPPRKSVLRVRDWAQKKREAGGAG